MTRQIMKQKPFHGESFYLTGTPFIGYLSLSSSEDNQQWKESLWEEENQETKETKKWYLWATFLCFVSLVSLSLTRLRDHSLSLRIYLGKSTLGKLFLNPQMICCEISDGHRILIGHRNIFLFLLLTTN